MSVLDRHFEKFHRLIALDDGRVERIKSAHLTLRDNVRADGPLSNVLAGLFLQGSYAQSTAIRPADRTEFDVDVVLAIDASNRDPWSLSSLRPPEQLIDWVASRLRQCREYEGKVRRKGRCVQIKYAGDFHMDVVPAHAPDGGESGLKIPDAASSEWIKSNPKGYLAWCTTQNRETDGRFTRVTKYMKWWRDNKVALAYRPKSIVLQTLIGKHLPRQADSDALALTQVMERMTTEFGTIQFLSSVPTVDNPSQPGENLAKRWNNEAAFAFGERLRDAARRARSALEERRDAISVELWQQVLGDRFPSGV